MPFMRGGIYDVKKIIGPVAVDTFTAMLEGDRLGIMLWLRFLLTRIAEPNWISCFV